MFAESGYVDNCLERELFVPFDVGWVACSEIEFPAEPGICMSELNMLFERENPPELAPFELALLVTGGGRKMLSPLGRVFGTFALVVFAVSVAPVEAEGKTPCGSGLLVVPPEAADLGCVCDIAAVPAPCSTDESLELPVLFPPARGESLRLR